MSNPYYTVTGAPTTQSRGYSATIRSEYGLIATGFDAVYTAMLLRGLKAGETWTGTHVFTGATVTFATQSALDNSTKAATTAYADSAVSASAVTLNAAIALKADIASPTFTGTPAAPTAALGTSTTQIATTAFVSSTAFSAALPSQTGNSGKFVTTDGTNASWSAVLPAQTSNSGKFLTTNGTAASWAYSNVASVTTATTATTLTSTPTLLKITPASYGVAVTLPDATTCSVGGPLHIIDNKGAYPVRVLNSAGTLLGFIFAGVVSHVSLADNSTSAGVWTIENNELVGSSAQLLTTNLVRGIFSCIDIGSNREVLVGSDGATDGVYALVYDRSTNVFGAPTLVRNANVYNRQASVLAGSDKVLVVSCNASTGFEAVVLSISGTTITVNTAATATLSANISSFADGCGLIAVGSSFVCSYTVATPAAQIRALSISGTTVTIGSASVPGTSATGGGIVVAEGDKAIVLSWDAGTSAWVDVFTVSGSTLSVGTKGATGNVSGAVSAGKLHATGTSGRFFYLTQAGGSRAGFATLSGTTITCSDVNYGAWVDAIKVTATKYLILTSATSNNANILTDTAGTASVGTAITLSSETSRACLYVSGTNVVVGETSQRFHLVSCSGASPVKTQSWQHLYNAVYALYATSNAVLSRTAEMIFGTTFAQGMPQSSGTASSSLRFSGAPSLATLYGSQGAGRVNYRGKADSERWVADAATVITKVECV